MKKTHPSKLTSSHVQQLRNICNRFGGNYTQEKEQYLQAYSLLATETVSVLKFYHDCLLFMLAYPENAQLMKIAARELERCITAASQFSSGSLESKKIQLSSTGITHSVIRAKFSFDLVQWIATAFPENISIFSCDAELTVQKDIMRMLTQGVQREALESNFTNVIAWFAANTKRAGNDLRFLLDFIAGAVPTPEHRDYFYDSLQIFVEVTVNGNLPSRSTASIDVGKIFYHSDELKRSVEAWRIISEKINAPKRLSKEECLWINTTARCSLLMLLRETDPITYSNTKETELHDMGYGIKIALFYSNKYRRLPIESYVGYMAFKNGLPIAYGGGWILGHFSRIGINIYEPFRGGESAFLFCQIIRLYKQRFNISVFEAEPYQIGKNNPEGIQSGAFWFYHRLGFRSSQPELHKLSEEEFNKISNDKTYRTEEKILKKLADSFMVLKLGKDTGSIISTLKISEAVVEMINKRFQGNSVLFENSAYEKIKEVFKLRDADCDTKTFKNLSQMLFLISGLEHWSQKEKNKTKKLFQYRDLESEYSYIIALQENKKLLTEVYAAIN